MAKPHKKANRAIQVTSALPADQLAGLCKDAADQCKIRLDDAQPGRLLFSVRGAIAPTKIHLMTFEVCLSSSDDRQVMASRILKYKTTQPTYLFIPVGPKRMVALSVYEKFMQRFSELTRHADPDASVMIAG
ncbi:MAG TPA: hypothetical protein VES97_11360 [Solirubrobacteraceae bacterium]|nr:hypothetical protein [Solirubrobacteraceae bacterium]